MEERSAAPLLKVQDLHVYYGAIHAIKGISLEVYENEIVTLIGANGAGKSSTLNTAAGLIKPRQGTVELGGTVISGLGASKVVSRGISLCPEGRRIFQQMTVEENVRIGLHNQIRYDMMTGILRLPRYWKQEKRQHEQALELLHIFGMEKLADEQAGSLPYGAQRRLEIVRALATNPSLLLLDEPAAGMNPHETEELMENIAGIRDRFPVSGIPSWRRLLSWVWRLSAKAPSLMRPPTSPCR